MMTRNRNEILIQKHCRQAFIFLRFFNLLTSIKQCCISYYKALMWTCLLQQFVWATSDSFPLLSFSHYGLNAYLSLLCLFGITYSSKDIKNIAEKGAPGMLILGAILAKNAHLCPAQRAERCHVSPISAAWLRHVRCVPGDGSRWSIIQPPPFPQLPLLFCPTETGNRLLAVCHGAPEMERQNQAEITPTGCRFPLRIRNLSEQRGIRPNVINVKSHLNNCV